jgi:hypothetical protein
MLAGLSFYLWFMKKLFLVLSILLASVATYAHPFHVSVVEISFNSELKRFECAVKLFTDDAERTLRNRYSQGVLDIAGANELPQVDSLLKDYLSNTLTLSVNNKALPLELLGKEGNADAIWTYVFFDASEPVSTVTVSGTMLFELFDDQKNLIHWQTDEVKTHVLTEENPTIQLVIQ